MIKETVLNLSRKILLLESLHLIVLSLSTGVVKNLLGMQTQNRLKKKKKKSAL